jgi:hypothetical protein
LSVGLPRAHLGAVHADLEVLAVVEKALESLASGQLAAFVLFLHLVGAAHLPDPLALRLKLRHPLSHRLAHLAVLSFRAIAFPHLRKCGRR